MIFKITFLSMAILSLTCCNSHERSNEDERAALNRESAACIRIMNSAEEEKNEALRAGDNGVAAAKQKTIDSAARENIKIGQKITALTNP